MPPVNTPAHPAEGVRIAVVGLGLIGRQRVDALHRIAGARLVATVDPSVSPKPGEHEVPHYRSVSEVPPDGFDCAVVAVPHNVAVDIARQLLGAGRAILIEKPLGVSSADARELEALAAVLERSSFVGYNYRYLPAIAEMMRRAQAGDLGRLRNLDLLVGHGGNPRSGEGWKLDPRLAGGGVLLDPGVHLLDLLLRLAPEVRCSNIEATSGFWPSGIEEDVVANFRHERMIGTVRVSHVRWVNTFRVELFGEDGYAIADGRGGNYGPMTLRIGRRWAWTQAGVVSQRESEQTWDYGGHNDSLYDELADVVARWRGDGPAAQQPRPASMSEARAITELCEQLYALIS
ncbi:MAG TPA: Gfo/Idh/MocA family oxidoreductase [Solirubrobacteraceae bacterium]|nr:Gfo/Idh/MocA family oxidoreductase [Solirubrobacteraceae bacterium]